VISGENTRELAAVAKADLEFEMAWRLGVDIGGTFTDFVLQNEVTGELIFGKRLTTPHNPAEAVLDGIYALLDQQGISIADLKQIIHGTTVGSNAVLERKGKDIALVTTRGFKDVLRMRRQKKYDMFSLRLQNARPLIPQNMIFEVAERMAYDGSVITPLADAEVRVLATELARQKISSVAVCFLHSYKNAEHEEWVGRIFREVAPEIQVSLSSEVGGVWREYERTSTVVANAYMMTVVRDYMELLESSLRKGGYNGDLYIVQSNGGLATVATILQYPVRILESGPAGGVIAAQFMGRMTGQANVIALDMGGTTAKSALIENGRITLKGEFEVDRTSLKPASGITVCVPAIDLIEVGTGGGSIAQPRFGTLAVGPGSAGAAPGPVCYGRGGTEPTTTDADVVLGYLNPEFFAGGSFRLERGAAAAAIEEKLAKPLGISVAEAAWGIHSMANLNMELSTRAVTIEKGYDPRMFTLVATGGAGPVHAARIAQALGCTRCLIPSGAGVASAIGMLASNVKFDTNRSALLNLAESDLETINRLLESAEQEAERVLAETRTGSSFTVTRTADLRYTGQGYELSVPLPRKKLVAEDIPAIRKAFEEVYAASFGYASFDEPIEGVTWRVSADCPAPSIKIKELPEDPGSIDRARRPSRKAYFPEYNDYVDCDVFDHSQLCAGVVISGPAVVEFKETTAVVPPAAQAHVDRWGNLAINLSSDSIEALPNAH
jgi:N-methylhydantoinase A